MILSKTIKIVISKNNKRLYSKYIDDLKYGDEIDILINYLSKFSKEKILVVCDVCKKQKEISYCSYNNNISKYNYYSCSQKCANGKNKLTCLEKYGDENYNNTKKQKETCLEKFGVEHISQSKYWRDKTGKIEKDGYDDYKRMATNVMRKNKKKLLENWDGYDYYDNEYIKDYFNLNKTDKDYPTIDHKISVYYGFINGISVEEISDINNLCYTKRKINASKNKKCEYEYRKERKES